MNVSNMNKLFLSVKKILKYFAHAVAQATDEVVGDMKCFADTSLKRSEFFMYKSIFLLKISLRKLHKKWYNKPYKKDNFNIIRGRK